MESPTHAGALIGGRYRLERRVASGGMATVWEAHDEVLTRTVAVKLLHPHLAADDQFVARFRREAVAAARLAHPSIVAIYDTCSQDATEAIVMELVRGTTLRAELDRRGRFTPAEASHVVAEVADALSCAHAAGIVHRDVKPANVLLSQDGRVLVTDFGIAKAADGLDLTRTNTTLGTVKYLAPEQVDPSIGPVDARTDIYAAGVILYELVTGTPPFTADTEVATALARLHRAPARPHELVAGIDPAIEAVILRAMARDPAARFATALELRDALRGAAAGVPPPEGPPTAAVPALGTPDATVAVPLDGTVALGVPPAGAPAPPAPAPAPAPARRRRRWAPAAVGTLVVAALVVTAILWAGTGGDAPGAARGGPPAVDGGGLAIGAVRSFDPEGDDGRENEDRVGLTHDGAPDTAWRTSCYSTPDFGRLKSGVGLVVELAEPSALRELRVDSPDTGWTAEVYVAPQAADSLDGWGTPVASGTGASPTTSFPIEGAEGGALLLWFTGLGAAPSPDCSGQPHAVSVSELAVV